MLCVGTPDTHLDQQEASVFERYRSRQRVINRWWLLLVLTRNPILLRYRKQKTAVQLAPRVFALGCTLHGMALRHCRSQRLRTRTRTMCACSLLWTGFIKRSATGFGGRWSKPKTRYVVLKDNFLVFYPTATDARVPHGTIALSSIEVCEVEVVEIHVHTARACLFLLAFMVAPWHFVVTHRLVVGCSKIFGVVSSCACAVVGRARGQQCQFGGQLVCQERAHGFRVRG